MTQPNEDFAAWSSLFFLPAAALLFYKGRWRFVPEVLVICLSAFFSVAYHTCTTSERQWCAGRTPDQLTLMDEMFAFLTMTAAVTPVLYQWMPHNGHRWRLFYLFFASLLTALLVLMYMDGLASSITLGLLHAGCVGYALTMRIHGDARRAKPGPLWLLRLVLALAVLVTGVVLRLVAAHEYVTNDAGVQTQLYLRLHAGWHCCIGVGATLFYTLLDKEPFVGENVSPKALAEYSPVLTTSGTVKPAAKPKPPKRVP